MSPCGASGCSGMARAGNRTNSSPTTTRTRDYLRDRAEALVRAAARGEIAGLDADQAKELAKQLRSAPMVTNVSVSHVAIRSSSRRSISGMQTRSCSARRPARSTFAPGNFALRGKRTTSPSARPWRRRLPGTLVPIWDAFLERIFRHDPELAPFMQRAIGYSLCGQISAHVLLFCWGQGGNGKGALLNTVSECSATMPPWRRRTSCS